MVRTAGINLAAMPAEAIPFAGLAVIVTTTALEIGNACQTMRDMEQIRADFGLPPDAEYTAAQLCGMEVPSEDALRRQTESEMRAQLRLTCIEEAGPDLRKQEACKTAHPERAPPAPAPACESLACCLERAGPNLREQEACKAKFPG